MFGLWSLISFFRQLPRGLVGCVGLIVVIELCLSQYAEDTSGDIAHTWRWSRWAVDHNSRNSRILCFGDSQVKFGVVPQIIEKETKLPTCNLALFEGRPPTSYLLLRKALDAGVQPAAIVVDCSMLYKDPVEYPTVWPELASLPEAAKLAWMGGNSNFFAHFGLSCILTSVRYRDHIRSELMAGLLGKESQKRQYHQYSQRNWNFNKGAFIIPGDSHLTGPLPKELDHATVVSVPWSCHPINEQYNRYFLDLARSRDIPVFWLLPPSHPALDQRLQRPTWDGLQQEYLEGLQREYPNLYVIDGTRSDYDSTLMGDLVHMNKRGACAFSDSVGKIINRTLANGPSQNSRWIALPPFREFADPPVEDIVQSINHVKLRR